MIGIVQPPPDAVRRAGADLCGFVLECAV